MMRQRFLPTLQGHHYFCLPESVGWYDNEPLHAAVRDYGTLNYYNLHIVTKGKGYVEIDGITYTLQKGDGFLFFPQQAQNYKSSIDDPWEVRWVHFYGHKIKEYLLENGLNRSTIWTLKQWKPIEQLFQELQFEAENHTIIYPTRLSMLLYGLLTEFITQAVPLTANKGTEGMERIVLLLPEMQKSACEPFYLDEWARAAGISVYYLCRLFRKATGMTPLAFITLCRLQSAKQFLLEQKKLSIKQIAMNVGYPNPSYFNKRFLQHEGVTPSEYRELH